MTQEGGDMNETSGLIDLRQPIMRKVPPGDTLRGVLAVLVILAGLACMFAGVALLLRGLLEVFR
jgi:hypothetical protein